MEMSVMLIDPLLYTDPSFMPTTAQLVRNASLDICGLRIIYCHKDGVDGSSMRPIVQAETPLRQVSRENSPFIESIWPLTRNMLFLAAAAGITYSRSFGQGVRCSRENEADRGTKRCSSSVTY